MLLLTCPGVPRSYFGGGCARDSNPIKEPTSAPGQARQDVVTMPVWQQPQDTTPSQAATAIIEPLSQAVTAIIEPDCEGCACWPLVGEETTLEFKFKFPS